MDVRRKNSEGCSSSSSHMLTMLVWHCKARRQCQYASSQQAAGEHGVVWGKCSQRMQPASAATWHVAVRTWKANTMRGSAFRNWMEGLKALTGAQE